MKPTPLATVNPMPSSPFAQLAMYPMAQLSAAYDVLWDRLRLALEADGVDGVPSALAWERDLHEAWIDPDAFITQTCGWPLVTALEGRVALIGSFDVDVPWASGGWYRSVIVSSKPLSVAEWRQRGDCRLIANNPDSLSGWVSLSWAWGHRLDDVPFTGAHVESLREVAAGRADLASIDAVTFAHMVDAEPTVAARVHVVGHGPSVPSLPLVCAPRFASNVPALRRALAAVSRRAVRCTPECDTTCPIPCGAVDDPELHAALVTLKIRGFVPLGLEAFAHLPGLLPPPAG